VTDDRISDLYALPLDEFTDARNALAKELAAAGDKAEAAEVRALKKPSVPAWAVNQVARAHPGEVEALFEAGANLRDAQQKLLRRGDQSGVKDASAAERQAVKALVARAKKILADADNAANEATLERIADTFYATTTDDKGREHVRTGTLTKEMKRAGFGDPGGLSVVPAARAKEEKPQKKNAQLQKEATKLQAAAEDAEQRAVEAEARASELMMEAEDARARADAAKEKARFARREATERRRDADRAARRLDRRG
jgi:hypothetical protein